MPLSNSTDSAGLYMYAVCSMGGFRWSFSMENWPPASRHEEDSIFGLTTSEKGTWGIWTSSGEDVVKDRSHWRCDLKRRLERGEEKQKLAIREKTSRRNKNNKATPGERVFACIHGNQDCHFYMGLYKPNICCTAISS